VPEEHQAMMWRRIAWFAGALAWVFIALSMATYHPFDPPAASVSPHNQPPLNIGGVVGAMSAHLVYSFMGYAAWALMGLSMLALVSVAAGREVTHVAVRALGAILIAATLSVFQALLAPTTGPVANLPGGVLGTVAEAFLREKVGVPGIVFFGLLGIVVGATVALDVWAWIVAAWTGRMIASGAKASGRAALAGARVGARVGARALRDRMPNRGDSCEEAPTSLRPDDVSDDERLPQLNVKNVATVAPLKGKKKDKATEAIDPLAGGLGATESFDPDSGGMTPADPRARVAMLAEATNDNEDSADESDDQPASDRPGSTAAATADAGAASTTQTKSFSAEDLRAKIAKLPVRFAANTTRAATEADLDTIQQSTPSEEGYRFPGVDLLEEPEVNFSKQMEVYVREQAEALERSLREYRIEGEVVGVESGPVITLYELRLAPGTKVAALNAISSDLARSLKAINIRIVPNMAGRDTVGVEVPNAQKEKVRLKELMTKSEVYGSMRLPMFLGKDAAGEPLIADLAGMPHLLIAGTTGSGKSVCMNSILMSFLYTKKPSELKLVLVDPKMVELSQFKDMPHLMCPVVTEMSKAAAILEWAVGKMDERYELLAEAGCRDIATYNELEWDELKERLNITTPEEEAKIPRKLPFMVFVIDELADLMMTNKEVEHSIVRLAQKARAVGMHLILATQRPQANVVTGLIKSNMPARIAFKVASAMDSRIVLDQKGGELLLGQGDMLYLSPRSSKLTRAQGTLVDDREIRRVAKFVRDVAQPTFERQLMQIKSSAALSDDDEGTGLEGERNGLFNAQEDPLFDQAVEAVLESKRGSVSMLQRRLAIGYTRAARLIEMMGEAGILGEHKGTVAREVAMTIDEWRALKAQAAADAEAREQEERKGELPRKPIAASLEQAQSLVNEGNLREHLEDESSGKATDALDDDDLSDDDTDDADDGEDADDLDEADDAPAPPSPPPFDIVTKVNRPGAPRS
jgi:DNA segregation ATPase FtsK/SpoIIIE, S-DNA-T family